MKRPSLLIAQFACWLGALLPLGAAFGSQLAQARDEGTPRFNGPPAYQIWEEKDLPDFSRGHFIASAPNNTVFVCAENGLHVFDGTSWRQILVTEATRAKIRTLHWSQGELFAAGYNTIGRLVFTPEEGLRYHSINEQPVSQEASEFYYQVHELGDWLHFVGTRTVAMHNRATGETRTHHFGTWVKASFADGGALYVATDKEGLWKLENDAFRLLPAFASFVEENLISFVARSPEGRIAFVTESGDFYHFEKEKALPAFAAFQHPHRSEITDIVYLDEARLAVAIAGSGVYIIDRNGRSLSVLDKQFDYRWGATRTLHVDRHGALWALFQSTIGKAVVSSPVTPVDERLRPALDYATAHYHDEELYLRTHGRLYRALRRGDGPLQTFENALPESSLSLALALEAEDGLLLHADDTTYILRDDELTPVGRQGRLDRLVFFRDEPNLLLGVNPRQLKLFHRQGDRLELLSSLAHTAGLVNKVARDRGDVFWLELGLARLGKVWLEEGQLRFRLYTADDGLPAEWVAIWEHEGAVHFTERSGVYDYDARLDRFVRSERWERFFPSDRGITHRIATDPSGNVWASYDHRNYILWKQPDGSYIKDSHSLSLLGEIYLNNHLFLENGDAILLSATEMFHFEAGLKQAGGASDAPQIAIAEVSTVEGDRRHYLNLGERATPAAVTLPADAHNVVIRLASSASGSFKQPVYQYFLEGLSKDWSKWSAANELYFSNLDPGAYRLKVRARVGVGAEPLEAQLALRLKPALHQSPLAYLLYCLATTLAILGGYRLYSRKLKSANSKLERMVAERTREIESKNATLEHQAETLERKNEALAAQSVQLKRNAEEMALTLEELRNAQDQLVSASRKAGMAEVATNVLHNVGNVLNSINVAALGLAKDLANNRVGRLTRIADLMDARRGDLPRFLIDDPKGRAIPDYLKQLSLVLQEDFSKYQLEVATLHDNIDHVKKIIATQQAHAKVVDLFQEIHLPEVIDSALTMILGSGQQPGGLVVNRDFGERLTLVSDKHRILQMVANFIKNSKEAIREAEPEQGRIDIACHYTPDGRYLRLTVSDNGIGIAPDHLNRIFTHGFTTKNDGHGFGMHSSANAAKSLGGSLTIDSPGIRQGATVTLILPLQPPGAERLELADHAFSPAGATRQALASSRPLDGVD